MGVKYLSREGTDLQVYSHKPVDVITNHMHFRNLTLIMEPGELLDFAQGHKLLTNGSVGIVILKEEGDALHVYDGHFLIFTPVTVRTSMVREGKSFRSIRIITRTLPPI